MPFQSRLSAIMIGLISFAVLAAPTALAQPTGLTVTEGQVLASSAGLSLAGTTAISDAELARIRGSGTGPGFSVNFGFTVQTFVNGLQVQSISMNPVNVTPGVTVVESVIPTLTTTTINDNIPISQHTITQDSTTTSTTTIPVENTSQLVSITNSIGGGGLTYSVNNTASNQAIQEIRTYNIDITGLQSQIQSASSTLSLQNSLIPH